MLLKQPEEYQNQQKQTFKWSKITKIAKAMTNYIIKEMLKWQGNNSNCKIKIQTNKQKKRHLNRESNGKIAKKKW